MNDADHIAQIHRFLDELWILYSPNESLRLRILAAKAGRWEWARLTTEEELDSLIAAGRRYPWEFWTIAPKSLDRCNGTFFWR